VVERGGGRRAGGVGLGKEGCEGVNDGAIREGGVEDAVGGQVRLTAREYRRRAL